MATKKGMDISVFQGDISWSKVTGIDFVIIRAGYGSNNIDSKAIQNIKGCTNRKIPFGLYWFSYALSVSDATKEANYVCDIADKYKLTFPVIAYDWEYDSDSYAAKCGVSMTNDMRYQFAAAFLKRVKQRGYTPLIYVNYDYLNKGFKKLLDEYDVWFAYPSGSTKPDVKGITVWQYSWKGNVPGINADVDMNYCYKEYKAGGTSSSTNTSTASNSTSKYTAEAVVKLALAEVGYKEKASNSQLDSKTANAGSNNWNKYAAYIDEHCPDFYNGKKNGFDWCDIFNDYIHIISAGDAEVARKALYQPKKSTGAGCPYSAQFFRDNNAWIDRGESTPKPGYQIFFGPSGNEYHTGIVVKVANGCVYTVEGNSSEMVAERSYALTDTKISGYGIPAYTGKATPASTTPTATQTNGTPDIMYRARVGGKWLPEVKNLNDYAGIVGKPITDIAIRVSKGSVKYRVHVKGGDWLPYVTGYNMIDSENGYAGSGKAIDVLEVYYYTPSDIVSKSGYLRAKYRVSPVNSGYYDWQYDTEKSNGQDGYAGSFGKTIDRLQITLSN